MRKAGPAIDPYMSEDPVKSIPDRIKANIKAKGGNKGINHAFLPKIPKKKKFRQYVIKYSFLAAFGGIKFSKIIVKGFCNYI